MNPTQPKPHATHSDQEVRLMRKTTRRRRGLAPLAAFALLLAACGGDDAGGDGGSDGEPPVIRVGYLSTNSIAPLMITASKFAEEEGFQVEMSDFPNGGEVLTGVVTGALDVGAAGIGSGAYNAFHEGLPFRMVAPQHNGFVEDYFMLSAGVAGSAEQAAAVAEDLTPYAGETFTVNAPGVVTEYLLGVALQRGGLSFGDVEVEYLAFPDMVPALEGGSVAGGIVSEPFPTAAEQQGAAFRPWATPDEEPLPFTVVIYNTDWAENNPDLAEAYLRAHLSSAQLLDERGWDDDEVLEIISEWTGLEPDLLRGTRPHHLPVDLAVDFDTITNIQQFYLDQGTLAYGELIDDRELWDLSWRDAALAGG
jgi:ABC-type nitrate/sulfonate/bicarbonate transport system substrate-binding protein